MQYKRVQYSTVECSKVQYIAVQYNTVQYSTVQYIKIQCSTIQYTVTLKQYTEQHNEAEYPEQNVRN